MKGCDICLISKTISHKFYKDLQSLSIFTNYWKNLFIDFVTGFSIFQIFIIQVLHLYTTFRVMTALESFLHIKFSLTYALFFPISTLSYCCD